mmetsp:Transcript_50927/g.110958  ORF Transcript_50927/g.110958 Transcript_50927/m.110958 type:complete len:368 (+) Transcript_50927:78-1181(+)
MNKQLLSVASHSRSLSRILLEMDRLVVGSHASLLESFTESRVCMTSTRDVLRRSSILHSEHTFGDHLTGVGSNDVQTKNAVRLLIGKHLNRPLGVAVGAGTRVSHERERPLVVGDALLLQLLLSKAHSGDFRVCVDNTRDGIIVDMSSKSGQVLNAGDSFLFSLVCKHGSVDAISNGVDRGNSRLEVVIHHNTAESVGFNTHLLESDVLSVRSSASADQDNIGLESLVAATSGSFQRKSDSVAIHLGVNHLSAELEVESLLLEDLLEVLGGFFVQGRSDGVQELNHSHLGTQTIPHTSHLEANDAAPNDYHLLRNGLEHEGTSRVYDLLAGIVHGASGERGHFRSDRQNNVLGLDNFLSTSGQVHRD